MDLFTKSYIETLLWSSSGEETSPIGINASIDEISPELMERIKEDCKNFQSSNELHIGGCYHMAGHDFALTRNRHGAGFWDGDWDKLAATILTDAAHAVGEISLYRGDDNIIYAM